MKLFSLCKWRAHKSKSSKPIKISRKECYMLTFFKKRKKSMNKLIIFAAIVSAPIIGMEITNVPKALQLGQLEKQIVALVIAQHGVADIRKQVEKTPPVVRINRSENIGDKSSMY